MSSYDSYSDIMDKEGPVLHHKPMDIEHRAKQFAPFAALTGLEACIHKQEYIYTERKELSEDSTAEMNFRLRMLQYGMRIKVVYFVTDLQESGKGHYETAEGSVRGYDCRRGLQLDDRLIPAEDLYLIKGDGLE